LDFHAPVQPGIHLTVTKTTRECNRRKGKFEALVFRFGTPENAGRYR
jgi:hypothetical protein